MIVRLHVIALKDICDVTLRIYGVVLRIYSYLDMAQLCGYMTSF